MTLPHASRRRWLAAGLAASALAPFTRLSFATSPGASRDARFVFVILRGGLDGLSVAPVIGEPGFAELRGELAAFDTAALPLEGPFALHPSLAKLHAMYGAGDAVLLHAVGLPYQQRSHFDAQQVLESGGTRPFELSTGWLGRSLAADPRQALALSTAVPLVLRGRDGVETWSPSGAGDPAPDLLARLAGLYAATDPGLADALASARRLRDGELPGMADGMATGMGTARPKAAQAVTLARKAGEFLAQPAGPRVAVLDMFGWDTHANQAGTLNRQLALLDDALDALRQPLAQGDGQPWRRTVVVVATEFGRAVQPNGTRGTDHGSGGAAFVLGGALQGGRVVADWPGLAPTARFEGRDLRTTTDLRGVLKGLLGDHLQMAKRVLERDVFPGSQAVRPVEGLLKA